MQHIYAKLDRTHALYPVAIAAAEAGFKARLPKNRFSEQVSPDGSVCWVKLVGQDGDDVEAIRAAAAQFMDCVLDTAETEAEHAAKVVPDVRAWEPE